MQMLVLNPKLAILDETDSGLDVDAIRTVSKGIEMYKNDENAVLIITHNTKILNHLKVDYVHVLVNGQIVKTSTAELAEEIEEKDILNIKNKERKKKNFIMKTKIDEINRNIYDIKDKDNYEFKMKKGLNEEIVREISKQKTNLNGC